MPDKVPDAVIEEMAKALFFSQHSIMHDHEKNWRKSERTLWREFARAALKAAEKLGYKLTSREPTENMLMKGFTAKPVPVMRAPLDHYRLAYRAMHDAAPGVE